MRVNVWKGKRCSFGVAHGEIDAVAPTKQHISVNVVALNGPRPRPVHFSYHWFGVFIFRSIRLRMQGEMNVWVKCMCVCLCCVWDSMDEQNWHSCCSCGMTVAHFVPKNWTNIRRRNRIYTYENDKIAWALKSCLGGNLMSDLWLYYTRFSSNVCVCRVYVC